MTNNIKIKLKTEILYIVCFSMVFSCQNTNDMTEFKPIVLENSRLIEEPKVIETDFYENLKLVLDYYEVKYELKNGVIYVNKDVYREKELMMNYTIKARDTTWLTQIGR